MLTILKVSKRARDNFWLSLLRKYTSILFYELSVFLNLTLSHLPGAVRIVTGRAKKKIWLLNFFIPKSFFLFKEYTCDLRKENLMEQTFTFLFSFAELMENIDQQPEWRNYLDSFQEFTQVCKCLWPSVRRWTEVYIEKEGGLMAK